MPRAPAAPTITATAATTSGRRPSTRRGRAARRALSHGLFSVAPIIPGVESEDHWLAHLAGVLDSLAPAGQLETLLAERVAFHFWRLKRLIRYETQLVASADPDTRSGAHRADAPAAPSLDEYVEPQDDPAVYERSLLVLAALDDVMFAADPKPIDPTDALVLIDELRAISCGFPLSSFAVPGAPDVPITACEAWTAGLVRQSIRAICQRFDKDPELQLRRVAEHHRAIVSQPLPLPDEPIDEPADEDDEETAERLYPRRASGLRTSMPLDSVLERIIGYERHVSRELQVALRELDSWQSRRLGRQVTHRLELATTLNGAASAGSAGSPTGTSVQPGHAQNADLETSTASTR